MSFLPYEAKYYLFHPWEVFPDTFKEIKYFIQRGRRGYSDRDLWSFDSYLTKVLAGGLKQFIDKQPLSFPSWREADTYDKWIAILKQMQSGFQAVLDYETLTWEEDSDGKLQKEAYALQEKSLLLLAKWFNNLWD